MYIVGAGTRESFMTEREFAVESDDPWAKSVLIIDPDYLDDARVKEWSRELHWLASLDDLGMIALAYANGLITDIGLRFDVEKIILGIERDMRVYL